MTREHAKELLPIITAFANGEEIQFKFKDNPKDTWSSAAWPTFDASQYDYRIKPKRREWFLNVYPGGEAYAYTEEKMADTSVGTSAQRVKVREILD